MHGDTSRDGPLILVPLDGSPRGEWALPPALALARRSGGRVRLAAVEQPYPVSLRQVALEPVRWAREYLARTRKRIQAAGVRDVEGAMLPGEVVPALEGYARTVEPDLVIMATHGRGALSRLWIGSVTDSFIRRSRWPVLVVRPGGDGPPPALEEEPTLRRFLVTLDGSPTSEAVLEPALQLRRLLDARVTLLRVVEFPPEAPPPFHRGPGPVDPAILDALLAEAREYVDGIVEDLGALEIPVTGMVEVAQRPAEAILTACRQHPVDLLAMGTQGRGALGRFMVGSVADKVVRGASLPVLLVRHEPREGSG